VVDQSQQPAVAQKVEVTLGTRERGVVEVLAGLKSGDVVVTDGVLKVRPGGPVQVRTAPASGASGDARIASQGASDKAGLAQ
jgi:multidrug efflux pump subunit AcrA (membrane-fusion protein)